MRKEQTRSHLPFTSPRPRAFRPGQILRSVAPSAFFYLNFFPSPTSSHPAPPALRSFKHTTFRNCHTDEHLYAPQHKVIMGVLTKLSKMIFFFVGATLVAASPITAPTDAVVTKPNCTEACKNLDAACQFFGLDPDTCHLSKCGSPRVSYRCQLSRGTPGPTESAVTHEIA
jgi:hypothetical protein